MSYSYSYSSSSYTDGDGNQYTTSSYDDGSGQSQDPNQGYGQQQSSGDYGQQQGGGSGDTSASPNNVQEGLDQHNTYRAEKGIAGLQWDSNLAAAAQAWAETLAQRSGGTFRLEHSPESYAGTYGENVAGANPTQGGHYFRDAVVLWVKGGPGVPSEEDEYNNGNPGAAGHYTAVMWSRTTHVGMGWAQSGNVAFVVANYSPAGNMQGETPF